MRASVAIAIVFVMLACPPARAHDQMDKPTSVSPPAAPPRPVPPPGAPAQAVPPPGWAPPPAIGLDAFLALPEAEREARRQEADELYHRWEEFRANAHRMRRFQNQVTSNVGATFTPTETELLADRGTGLLAALQRLITATARDPSHTRAWSALGGLRLDTGAFAQARAAFQAAERALQACPEGSAREQRELRVDVLRGMAWAARQEGNWEEGLGAADRGLRLAPKDPELMLVRGLLLAGAGRFVEACTLAQELPPLEYRVYGYERLGLSSQRSDYGSRWIQAMAYVNAGEPRLALYVLGELRPQRREIPFMSRYWQDVGLVYEVNARPAEASVYYGIALVTTPFYGYFPFSGFSAQPHILGEPDVRLPAFIAWNQRHLAGSLFTYGAQLAAECAADPEGAHTPILAALADSALTTCLRWRAHATRARALRGQLYCALGRQEEAEADLTLAHNELTAAGQCDPRTSMLLGILKLQEDQHAAAVGLLRESTLADSTLASAWRALGVAQAEVGQLDEADAAMSRGIALDPQSAEGWYNRGVLRLRRRLPAEGARDLRVAAELAPENAAVATALAGAQPLAAAAEAAAGAAATGAAGAAPGAPAAPPAGAAAGTAAAPQPALAAAASGLSRPLLVAPASAYARVPQALPDTSAVCPVDVRDLERRYRIDPAADRREALAVAYFCYGFADRVLELLAPAWERGLSPTELRLIVQSERALGKGDRTAALARRVDPSDPRPADADLWALVAIACYDNGAAKEGRRALDAALKLAPGNTGLRLYDSMQRRGR